MKIKVWFVYMWHDYESNSHDGDIESTWETFDLADARAKKLRIDNDKDDYYCNYNIAVVDMSKWILG